MRLAALSALVLALAAGPAGAAVSLGKPDTSRYPEISVTAVAPTVAAAKRAPAVSENGRPVVGLRAENLGRAKAIVLAVDTSRSMAGRAMADAVAAARSFVAAKGQSDRIALVGFGERAQQLTQFSAGTIDADTTLRTLSIDDVQGTALHDAIALGARALGGERLPARVLIVVTDGRDVSSSASAAEAVAAAREAGVAVYAIGIEGPQFSPDALRELAQATGGTYRGAEGSGALGSVYASIAEELRRTWRLSYVTAARPGEALRLEIAGSTVDAVAPGRAAPPRVQAPSRLLPGAAYGPAGSLAVGLLVGALLLAAVVLGRRAGTGSWVRERLAPHVGERTQRTRAAERFAAGSALMAATESAFGHLKVWRRLAKLLERADVPLRTVELVYIVAGAGLGLGLLAALAGAGGVAILVAMAAGGSVPIAFVSFRARRRLKAFENQLPDLLLTLAAALKAGQSFKQGLQTVVNEGAPPASKEFQRVLAETRLGRPMEEALTEMAERVGSTNLEFVVTSVTIQSQVGGSLAGLFDMVADAVRERQQFARKIKGLTAMGRASAYVLIALPFFIAGAMLVINAEYIAPLYQTSTGHVLIGITLVMMTLGSLVLRKIVDFKG